MDLIKFKVTGVVQGVCFRMYTQREARRLGIRGWCYNHPDDSVEGLAVGSSDALKQFTSFLHRGPPAADVEKVALETQQDVGDAELKKLGVPEGFEVRRHG